MDGWVNQSLDFNRDQESTVCFLLPTYSKRWLIFTTTKTFPNGLVLVILVSSGSVLSDYVESLNESAFLD